MFRLLYLFCLLNFVVEAHAQSHHYEVSADYREEMWDESFAVVSARVVSRGRCVRMEVVYCTIHCVITESHKGKLKTGDTITIEVVEYGNISLGGKLVQNDEPVYTAGRSFVFFLERGYVGKFHRRGLYQPVDDVKGVFYPSPVLYEWIRTKEKLK